MGIISKNSILYPILYYKCPRCREGNQYEHKLTEFKGTFNMKDHCDQCGQKYILETGFYWGAMYVSYGIAGGIMLAGYTLLLFLTDWGVWPKFFFMTAIVFILYGWIFRTARSVWITMHVKYKGEEAITAYQHNKTGK